MDVLLGGSSDNVVMVGHEYYVMDENIIFFSTFGECFKDYTCDLPLFETESSVIGSTDQVIGKFSLYDTRFSCHAREGAGIMPKTL